MTERVNERSGEVFDLGYQHYDGPREGRSRARIAIFNNGVRTVLGLGRGPKAKILPILLFVSAILPASIFVIILSVAGPAADFLPGPADYYRVVSLTLLIFTAIMAPELLIPDRRDGVLQLYLVRPLTATDYVVGRFLSFFVIVLALVYSGQVMLQIGLILAAADPVDFLRDNWLDIPRFLAAGIVVALFITVVPMAVASVAARRAYAAVFVIGLYFISTPVAAGLTSSECHHAEVIEERVGAGEFECEPVTGDAAKWFSLIAFAQTPIRINDMIFDNDNEDPVAMAAAELPAGVPIAWYLLMTAVPGFLLWWRYQRVRL